MRTIRNSVSEGDGETTDPEDEGPGSCGAWRPEAGGSQDPELTDPEHGMDIYDGALEITGKLGTKDIVHTSSNGDRMGWEEKFVDVLASENIPSTVEMSPDF